MRSSSSAQTIMGTGLLSNSSRNEASRCFSSVMSTRRPMTGETRRRLPLSLP
jgi:hypothetical protein